MEKWEIDEIYAKALRLDELGDEVGACLARAEFKQACAEAYLDGRLVFREGETQH